MNKLAKRIYPSLILLTFIHISACSLITDYDLVPMQDADPDQTDTDLDQPDADSDLTEDTDPDGADTSADTSDPDAEQGPCTFGSDQADSSPSIVDTVDSHHNLIVADLDFDGLEDVILASTLEGGDAVLIFHNVSDGPTIAFDEPHIIPINENYRLGSVQAFHMDRFEDLELLLFLTDETTGGGVLGIVPEPFEDTPEINEIPTNYPLLRGQVGMIDGDIYGDIVASAWDENKGDGEAILVYWIRNGFELGEPQVLPISDQPPDRILIADLNSDDGTKEVIVSIPSKNELLLFTYNSEKGRLEAVEGVGSRRCSPDRFLSMELSENGQPTIIYTCRTSEVYWLVTAPAPSFAAEGQLENPSGNKRIIAGDFDGDRDADLFVFTGSNLNIYCNESGDLTGPNSIPWPEDDLASEFAATQLNRHDPIDFVQLDQRLRVLISR